VTFEFESGGTTRQIENRDARFFLDGRPVDVDAVKAGPAWSILIGGRSYEVFLVERGPGQLIAHVNGRAVTVRGGPQRFGSPRDQAVGSVSSVAADGPRHVAAPMPGRIAKVLVRVGDRVTAHQGLVVVEAMKMENELRSPRAGIVTEIRAAEGALVEANAILIVLE
jgi:biotin carboxyl carrier protein